MDNLARLHALDYEAAGLGEIGKPEGYVERQVTGWTRRYRDARTDEFATWSGPRPGWTTTDRTIRRRAGP